MPLRNLFFFFGTLLSVGLWGLSAPSAFAQKTRQQLEKEKKDNEERMRQTQEILAETASQKKVSLGQLNALNQQINTQKKRINLLSDDLQILNKELTELEQAQAMLSSDLAKLKKEYGQMVYEASKRSAYMNQLIFLFSAPTFNQLLLRYKYLKQYTDQRQEQAHQMEKVQRELTIEKQRITAKKQQQQGVLDKQLVESQKLDVLKGKQGEVVKQLSAKEKELRDELARNRRDLANLESNIKRIIEREMRERMERERREREAREKAERERVAREKAERERAIKAGETPPPVEKREEKPVVAENNKGFSEEEVTLASSFTASRARLPWPVRGFVSDQFGRKAHPVLKGVMVDNLGIDIQTTTGELVRAVYDGVVLDVAEMPGMNNVVAVQHGDYMTVYAKMKSVSVRTGQRIKAREAIGAVATTAEGTSELQFQIWKNTTRLNPEQWLLPK